MTTNIDDLSLNFAKAMENVVIVALAGVAMTCHGCGRAIKAEDFAHEFRGRVYCSENCLDHHEEWVNHGN